VGAFLKNNMVCMIILGQREIEKGGGMKYEWYMLPWHCCYRKGHLWPPMKLLFLTCCPITTYPRLRMGSL
jgi:hypothetical protein